MWIRNRTLISQTRHAERIDLKIDEMIHESIVSELKTEISIKKSGDLVEEKVVFREESRERERLERDCSREAVKNEVSS